MTDSIFDILVTYGLWGVCICAYFSCLLVPIPTSLIMLAGGALIAAGELSAPALILSAFFGAILGDQTGYFIGRKAGQRVLPRLAQNPARAKVIVRAEHTIDRSGGLGVFFSTWLFAPLGPYVNVVAGAGKLPWLRFTIWDILGEAIWVCAYVGMGYVFADHLSAVADVLKNVLGILIASGIGVIAAIWIGITLRAQKMAHAEPDQSITAPQAQLGPR